MNAARTDALLPFPGSKRKLWPLIAAVFSGVRPVGSWPNLAFADAFLGAGNVALAAKTSGFGAVMANDIAERSLITGRALVANSGTRLAPHRVLGLLQPAPRVEREEPAILLRTPEPARSVLRNCWAHLHAGTFTGTERDMMWLLVLKLLFRCFPMSLPSASDAGHAADGDFDHVSHARLGHYLGNARRIAEPETLLRIAKSINDAIVPGAAEIFGLDVFEFLRCIDADVVYLDPPYGGTQSYEKAFSLVDEFIGAPPLPPSAFSSRRPPLDDLLAACAHIPALIFSINNTLFDEDGVRTLVSRHRRVERLVSVPYAHYRSVATAEKNRESREFLVLGVR
jgi:16S rRNA G966 N2-methylase RsmD